MSARHLPSDGATHCELSIRRDDLDIIVEVIGEVDVSATPTIERTLRDLIEDQGHLDVVVDLEEVTFIDSHGVRLILAAHNELRGRRGQFTVLRPSPVVRRVLGVLGLDDEFHIETAHADSAG